MRPGPLQTGARKHVFRGERKAGASARIIENKTTPTTTAARATTPTAMASEVHMGAPIVVGDLISPVTVPSEGAGLPGMAIAIAGILAWSWRRKAAARIALRAAARGAYLP
jgi:hypothetical protein